MSRVDEALKRAAGVPLSSRPHLKPFSLDDYVGEHALEPVTSADETVSAPVHEVESPARLSVVRAVGTAAAAASEPLQESEPEPESDHEPEAHTSNGPLRFKLPG